MPRLVMVLYQVDMFLKVLLSQATDVIVNVHLA